MRDNPNVHEVHELTSKGFCKERSDGRAIVTKSIASNAVCQDIVCCNKAAIEMKNKETPFCEPA